MKTPVILIIFNRPKFTERVVKAISRARPEKLFVVADGPRENHPEDKQKCEEARAVIDQIEWPCEIVKDYAEKNLGCGLRPATGITAALAQVDRAIILEDDCIPSEEFFPYCDELLERYKDDYRVMQVCGANQLVDQSNLPFSYYFSRNIICLGGWATWTRAWQFYDIEVKSWPKLKGNPWFEEILQNDRALKHYVDNLGKSYEGKGNVDYWDYQWQFSVWSQHGLSIMPVQNLVTNIGFCEDSTHTKNANAKYANVQPGNLQFPLTHPDYMIPDIEADSIFIKRNFAMKRNANRYLLARILDKSRQMLKT
jgi:hypothetical protein